MKIGVGLDARLRLSPDELRSLAKDALFYGFESMWTPGGAIPDAFHVCARWSEFSKQYTPDGIDTGIAVIPAPREWKPETLAAQAATVAALSGDKFVLGIGTGGYGDDAWDALGLPHRPIAVMKDFLTTLKALFAGETVSLDGAGFKVANYSIGREVNVPVYLAALGPQMLRLAATHADGVCLNWATPEQITTSAKIVADAATAAGRNPADIPLSMYVRVCIDDDVAKARQALAFQVLGYALARPGTDPKLAYRGLFTQMGFDEELTHLEQLRDSGMSMRDLTEHVPEALLHAVGYYGPAEGAVERFRELSVGLDEAIVRIISAGRGLEPVVAAMSALSPAKIRGES